MGSGDVSDIVVPARGSGVDLLPDRRYLLVEALRTAANSTDSDYRIPSVAARRAGPRRCCWPSLMGGGIPPVKGFHRLSALGMIPFDGVGLGADSPVLLRRAS